MLPDLPTCGACNITYNTPCCPRCGSGVGAVPADEPTERTDGQICADLASLERLQTWQAAGRARDRLAGDVQSLLARAEAVEGRLAAVTDENERLQEEVVGENNELRILLVKLGHGDLLDARVPSVVPDQPACSFCGQPAKHESGLIIGEYACCECAGHVTHAGGDIDTDDPAGSKGQVATNTEASGITFDSSPGAEVVPDPTPERTKPCTRCKGTGREADSCCGHVTVLGESCPDGCCIHGGAVTTDPETTEER